MCKNEVDIAWLAGKSVLVEKPYSIPNEQAIEVVRTIENAKKNTIFEKK